MLGDTKSQRSKSTVASRKLKRSEYEREKFLALLNIESSGGGITKIKKKVKKEAV